MQRLWREGGAHNGPTPPSPIRRGPYLFRYALGVSRTLLQDVRRSAGLSVTRWAQLAGTSRPTLSAYLAGRVDPRLSTVERLVEVVGLELSTRPSIGRVERTGRDGTSVLVLDHFPRLPINEAFRRLTIPHLLASQRATIFDLRDHTERTECFRILLTASRPKPDALDIIATSVDAAALMTVWAHISLDPALKSAWEPSLLAS